MSLPSYSAEHLRVDDFTDLNNSISLSQEAVDLTPDGNLGKPVWLNNLGNALLTRFEYLGDLEDVHRAVSAQEEAVRLATHAHRNRSVWLIDLSNSLIRRFERLPDPKDLEKAISARRDALQRIPLNHRNRPIWLVDLGNWLFCRFERLGDLEHLTRSILVFEEAIHLVPDSRPDKSVWLNKLGISLFYRFECLGDRTDATKLISAFENAHRLVLDGGPDKEATSPALRTAVVSQARTVLVRNSVHEVLNSATKFNLSAFDVYQICCYALEGHGHVMDAIVCFRRMQIELRGDANCLDNRAQWEHDFQRRCVAKLEQLGNAAMRSKNYNMAITYYANALSLEPTNEHEILKCCKARERTLEEELIRVNEDIEKNPSSYKGYGRKHAVLHRMCRYREAFEAFTVMLSKMDQSLDEDVRKLRQGYFDATPAIIRIIQQTIRHMPRELIDSSSGELNNREKQALAFERLPIFHELRSFMTMRVDHARIQQEVRRFYRYAMFSHRWESGEPTFEMVQNIPVYRLPLTRGVVKLRNFCKLVSHLGFRWAWSDTCCINQSDKNVQQESVLSMFRWYRGSTVTIIHLLDVFSYSEESDRRIWNSTWNTRGWTYQEYVASEVVQFYTEDWKPYLGLDMFNHKTSPIILSEMEHAMNLTTKELTTIQPDLNRVREKLYMASRRQTTREEDIAYCLFGIFNAALPVIYGEGNQAVGRLLDHVVTGSRDITILAWTGCAGSYNSCLPMDLTVYDPLVPPHIPQPIVSTELDRMVMMLRSSLPDLSQAVELHRCLSNLPPPSFAASRLQLSGITFPVTDLVALASTDSKSDLHTYRARTSILGEVEITTTDDVSRADNLILIHPWIAPLLSEDSPLRRGSRTDPVARALRFVARLRQPFGALLLTSFWGNQYKRAAADCLIMVQVREEVDLAELTESVMTVDVQ